MLTATAMVVVGMALALVLLVALWVSVRTWRARRAEYLRRQQLLGSVLNAQMRRERGG